VGAEFALQLGGGVKRYGEANARKGGRFLGGIWTASCYTCVIKSHFFSISKLGGDLLKWNQVSNKGSDNGKDPRKKARGSAACRTNNPPRLHLRILLFLGELDRVLVPVTCSQCHRACFVRRIIHQNGWGGESNKSRPGLAEVFPL